MWQHEAPVETECLGDHLSLVAHCALVNGPDDAPRVPGRIVIETLGGAWMVSVLDVDKQRMFCVLGRNLDDTLTLADDLLRLEAPPWSDISSDL